MFDGNAFARPILHVCLFRIALIIQDSLLICLLSLIPSSLMSCMCSAAAQATHTFYVGLLNHADDYAYYLPRHSQNAAFPANRGPSLHIDLDHYTRLQLPSIGVIPVPID